MMDEAGHAEEPLALAALSGLAGRGCQVVLAGDPQQLGPVITSPFAQRGGLAVSLMERLVQSPPYARLDGNAAADAADASPLSSSAPSAAVAAHHPHFITKLVRNYRSHGDILALPNALFYQGELQQCADPVDTDAFLGWDALPEPSLPVVRVHSQNDRVLVVWMERGLKRSRRVQRGTCPKNEGTRDWPNTQRLQSSCRIACTVLSPYLIILRPPCLSIIVCV